MPLKSSWTCLLLKQQGALVSLRKHLGYRVTGSFWAWLSRGPPVRAHIIHYSTDYLLINSTPFMVDRPLLLLRRATSKKAVFASPLSSNFLFGHFSEVSQLQRCVESASPILTNVSKELGYRLYERGIEVLFAAGAEILLLSKTSTLGLGPNQPLIQ
jgi:hypothetical protein